MRTLFLFSTSVVILALGVPTAAQQNPTRDPIAVAVVLQSLLAMGGTAPADSVATGAVTIVAGSKTDTGTIRILTRGVDQTAEEITTSDGLYAEVYSKGRAAINDRSATKLQSRQWAASSQSTMFLLPKIAAAINNPDSAFAYDGIESINNRQAHHIRIWNTYASESEEESNQLSKFSLVNIWVEASSGLPSKISFERRAAEGVQALRVEVYYSDYRKISGILYPFNIAISMNGTPFATIIIGTVSFNTGLTDASFVASQVAP